MSDYFVDIKFIAKKDYPKIAFLDYLLLDLFTAYMNGSPSSSGSISMNPSTSVVWTGAGVGAGAVV